MTLKDYKAELVLIAMKMAGQVVVMDDKLSFKDHYESYAKSFIKTGNKLLKENYVE